MIIVIDATEGVTEQDAKIAGIAHDRGKGIIIAVNKWDAIEKDNNTVKKHTEKIRQILSFMPYAEILFISAKSGQRLNKIFEMIDVVIENNSMRVATGVLNEIVTEAVAMQQPPTDKGKRLKIYYVTQVAVKPPTFVVFVNDKNLMHFRTPDIWRTVSAKRLGSAVQLSNSLRGSERKTSYDDRCKNHCITDRIWIRSVSDGISVWKSKGIDIRQQGSGNAGTTNSLRVLGWKAGIITFAGDLLKAVFAVLLVKLIFHGTYGADTKVLELYAGFGTVLGHNFPCYLQFRGGKGIACTTGVILAVCPPAVICCAVGFLIIVGITRYVSVGSIFLVSAYLVQAIIFGQIGWLKISGASRIEFYILSACFTGMAIWRHRANIVRLMNGTENKFGTKKEINDMAKVGVIGAGSWGIALAKLLRTNGNEVTVWSIVEEEVAMLRREHEHIDKLPGVKLPEDVLFTTDLKEAIVGKEFLILAVPSVFTRSTAKSMAGYVTEGQIIVCVAKGIEEDTLMTISDVTEQEIPCADVAVMCGPSHAEEVGIGLPTTVVAGAKTESTAKKSRICL